MARSVVQKSRRSERGLERLVIEAARKLMAEEVGWSDDTRPYWVYSGPPGPSVVRLRDAIRVYDAAIEAERAGVRVTEASMNSDGTFSLAYVKEDA